MNARQKIEALVAAHRNGESLPELWSVQQSITPNGLNHLNPYSSGFVNSRQDHGSSGEYLSLNTLKQGVSRRILHTDPLYKRAISWGVKEWLIQLCIREYGEKQVKDTIHRLSPNVLADSYFKPHYGPIDTQRGRLFNKEMQKLKTSKANERISEWQHEKL